MEKDVKMVKGEIEKFKKEVFEFKRDKWFVFKISLTYVAIYFFCLGFMFVDYGASAKGLDIAGQSLVFNFVEPRILYHTGLFLMTASFFVLLVLCAYYLSMERK
jgi:hypothetical protein